MSHQVPEDRKLCTGLGIWHFGPREDFSTFRLSASRAAGLTPTSCSPFLRTARQFCRGLTLLFEKHRFMGQRTISVEEDLPPLRRVVSQA